MCGIAGCVVAPGATVDRVRLEAARDALHHRGPDGSGVAVFENVGLAHTRLAIDDLSQAAHQPLWDEASATLVSFNGEIFNHRDLRRTLGEHGLRSSGDTATLAALLGQQWTDAIPALNGQFAIAALSVPRRRLLLARDRFGVKPLFVASHERELWFTSELRALAAAGVPLIPTDCVWDSLLRGTCYAGANTLLQNVIRLPPGSAVEIEIDRPVMSIVQWYEPLAEVDAVEQEQLSQLGRRQLTDRLESALRCAVRDALHGDVEIGTLLSGGVDSSLIAALASEQVSQLHAYGARVKGDPVADEGPAAARAADALGIDLDIVEVTPESWREGFVDSAVGFGLPLANASSVPIAQMAARARASGIKVLLTGEGADELFAGYGTLHADAIHAFSSPQSRAVRWTEATMNGRLWSRLRTAPARATPIWETLTSEPSATGLAYASHEPYRRTLEVQLLARMDHTLSHLLHRMDANVMQESVEARVPFLDPRVVRLALNLPLESRVGPWSKGVLRDVARRLLPLRVAHRPKVYGMDYDAGDWILAEADQGFLTHGMLTEVTGVPGHEILRVATESPGALPVRVWSAEIWCRSVLAGERSDAIAATLWRGNG